MLKKVAAILLSSTMLLSVVACGGGKQGGEPYKSDKAGENKTEQKDPEKGGSEAGNLSGDITLWHSFTQGPRLEKIQKTADSFVKENPDVNITIETFSWADFYTKWTTGLASNNVPDMSSALSSQVVEMIDAQALNSLDGLVDRIGRDKFYENALKEMTGDDGKIYGVPLYSNTQAMWVRHDLLDKYNLEVPETWDELYEAAKVITEGENGEVYGLSMPMGTNDMMATRWLHMYVRSAGETLITEDGKANLTSPVALDGIRYWTKVYNEISPKDSMNYNVLDEATMYYQGKLAFDFNTGFHINGVKANSPDLMQYIDCYPIPRIKKGDPVVGVESNHTPFVSWKASKHPEVVEAFIEYFYEPEHYVDFLLSVPVGMMSAIKGVTDDENYQNNEIVKEFKHADGVLQEMLGDSTSIGMEYGPCAEAGLLTSQRVIENMFQNIVVNGTDVEQAAADAEKQLNDIFQTVE